MRNKVVGPHNKFLFKSCSLERDSYPLKNGQELFVMKGNDHGDDPSTFDQVIANKDLSKWLKAVKSKMDSMHANQVWTLVNPF